MSESCCVVEDKCTCPANLEQKEIDEINLRTKCFACGLTVCKECSKIIKWYLYGKRRICLNCIDMAPTQKPISTKKGNKMSKWKCIFCKPGQRRRTQKAHRVKCFATCEFEPHHCLANGSLVKWQRDENNRKSSTG